MLVHREQLILRVAYAGAPLSGKTESMKALLASLRGPSADDELVFSPLAARGRTLYFDWAQYQGGTFRDGQLHCQITSVPGQATLHQRRRLLIEEADVVVFVVDSQPDQMEANQRSLAELRPWLERGDLPPISVIYQANKRDLAGALELERIREVLALGSEAELYESSATLGEGVRICFVAAVRACVRRAEALHAEHKLLEGEPEVATGEQLLRRLRLAEGADGHDAHHPPTPTAQDLPGASSTALEATAEVGTPTETAAVLAFPPARPAVMPFADWLTGEARQGTAPAGATATPAEATPAPVFPSADPPTDAAADFAAMLTARAAPPSRPAVMPFADWQAALAATATAASEPPPLTVPLPATAPEPPPSPLLPPSPPSPTVELPAPWLPGHESTLIEAWPPAVWREIRLAVKPPLEPPVDVAGTLKGRLGAGWQARSWGVLPSLETARAEFDHTVSWLKRLGDVVSGRRCLVLCGSAKGWCVWQVVYQELTFDLLVRQCLEEELLSKYSVQVLARVATDFVLASQEFVLRGAELPVSFLTLTHENRATVYSAFLPPEPVPQSDRDPLVELASELRAVIPIELLSAFNVTEALRELEYLREERPYNVPTVEVLQSLLIGE